jgi:hypothetical protein
MIIRPLCKKHFVALPNSLFTDKRLSADTRAMLALLLSKPRGWELRPVPLMKQLSREGETPIGRTRLRRMLDEATAAGYIARAMHQRHDTDGKWGKYEYIVGMPEDVLRAVREAGVAFAPQLRDPHEGLPHAQNDFTNHKEQIPPTNIYKNDHHHPVLLHTLGKGHSSSRERRPRALGGKEIIQHRLAVRLGVGDAEQGWLILGQLSEGRRDELTARERLGSLSDLEVSNAIASISLKHAKEVMR